MVLPIRFIMSVSPVRWNRSMWTLRFFPARASRPAGWKTNVLRLPSCVARASRMFIIGLPSGQNCGAPGWPFMVKPIFWTSWMASTVPTSWVE